LTNAWYVIRNNIALKTSRRKNSLANEKSAPNMNRARMTGQQAASHSGTQRAADVGDAAAQVSAQ